MPPVVSDDEQSDSPPASRASAPSATSDKRGRKAAASQDVEMEEPKQPRRNAAKKALESNGFADNDEEREEEEEEEELDEDVYVVEKILAHSVDPKTGELRYQVKWEGFDKKEDLTWEPEENLLEAANEVLDEYLESVGGREKIMEDNRKALDRQAAKKKRGRAATASQGNAKKNGTGGTAAKRTKTAYGGDDHPGAASPPASRVAAEWQPPVGSWEDKLEIIGVHITPETGRLWVMVEWKEDGRKTQHLTDTIYLRCPQKMLRYYESKVIIREDSPEPKSGAKN